MALSYGNYKLDQEKFDKLVAVADTQEKTTLKVLYNAVVKSINILNENSSAISVKDWETTKTAYEDYADTLWGKYFQEKPQTLANVLAVVDYLTNAGYKIKKSKAYKDQKEGLLRPEKDGTYAISTVDKYAVIAGLKRLDGKGKDSLDKIQEEKAQVELEKAREQRDYLRHKNKVASGLFVPRDDFERELTKRALVLKSDFENYIRGGVEKKIALVDGDPAKAPALIEHELDALAEFLDRYSGDREFKVPEPTTESILQDPDDDEGLED
jgi:hypothetical protein